MLLWEEEESGRVHTHTNHMNTSVYTRRAMDDGLAIVFLQLISLDE